jgi:secreted trypsin-like serine protease
MAIQILVIILCFFYTACSHIVPLEPVATLLQCHEYNNSSDSIINGQQVGYGDPDQKIVLLLQIRHKNHDSVCTGTLISERVILTAAHCVNNIDPDDILAQFITTEGCPINQIREMRREITSMIIHKSFDGTPQSLSDLALLYLDEGAPTEQQRIPVLTPQKKNNK